MSTIPKRHSAWPVVSLGSVVKFLSGGTPSMAEAKYWNGDIPWVSSGEMTQRRIHSTKLHLTEDGANKGSKRIPARTVLIVVRGMSLAKEFRVAITDREVTFNQDLKALLPCKNLLPEYLFYYLLSQNQSIRDSASESAHGTKKLDTQVLEEWPVPLPSISTQKKIAAILSAYDELIENNQLRIKLLEKMVAEIYCEWFVRLRFPGHDKVKFVKGVPEGWELRTLASIAGEIKQGVKKKNLADDEIYIGLEHIPRRSIAIKEWATADTVDSDKLLFQERDILFCKIRPYLHKVSLSHVAGACSSDTIVIRPKNRIYEGYLLFTVFSDTFIELATIASKGTKMPRADWGFLKQIELAIPNTQLLEAYQTQFDSIFLKIVNLLRENEALITSRDMLLPRLISGKLSVENLGIQFPPGIDENAHEY